MMADEINFLWSEIQNYTAEADADSIPVSGQLEFAVFMLWCFLFVADLILRTEELELHYRCRGKSNLRKNRIATISVRMVAPEIYCVHLWHGKHMPYT